MLQSCFLCCRINWWWISSANGPKETHLQINISPVYCSDRTVNILTVKEANSQAKQVSEKSRACVCFSAKHTWSQILPRPRLVLIPDGMSWCRTGMCAGNVSNTAHNTTVTKSWEENNEVLKSIIYSLSYFHLKILSSKILAIWSLTYLILGKQLYTFIR